MAFQDIKGQDKPIQILKEHIKKSSLNNSYLFAGPDGVGKRLVAKTLAKALNCENQSLDPSTSLRVNGERSRTIDSCDRCPSCLKIDKGQHPDVYMIDASTPLNMTLEHSEIERTDSQAIRIGHIRQLQKDISLKPYEAKLKVFIIDNAHNLTPAASNALLKILEEPPVNSFLILISAKPVLLFKTIISRCQILRFSPLVRAELEDILSRDYSLDKILAHFLAYFCEGRLGLSLALKDTDIMQDKNRLFEHLVSSKEQTNLDSFLTLNKEHLRRCLNILASWFRDIYLVKIGIPHSELINFDQKMQILKCMPRFSFTDLDELLKCITDSLFYLEQNINTKLLLSNLSEDITYGAKRT